MSDPGTKSIKNHQSATAAGQFWCWGLKWTFLWGRDGQDLRRMFCKAKQREQKAWGKNNVIFQLDRQTFRTLDHAHIFYLAQSASCWKRSAPCVGLFYVSPDSLYSQNSFLLSYQDTCNFLISPPSQMRPSFSLTKRDFLEQTQIQTQIQNTGTSPCFYCPKIHLAAFRQEGKGEIFPSATVLFCPKLNGCLEISVCYKSHISLINWHNTILRCWILVSFKLLKDFCPPCSKKVKGFWVTVCEMCACWAITP